MVGRGLLFQAVLHLMTLSNSESVVGVKPDDSGVVIGYQVDEFNHTWFIEHFIAHSHIYPGFTGKVSTLTHCPIEPSCEDYCFLDQAMVDFEHGLILFSYTPLTCQNWSTSLKEADAIPSSVSSGCSSLGYYCF